MMKVKWSPDAKERMDKTADFIQERFGLKSKMRPIFGTPAASHNSKPDK